jgi:CDP-glycerol glycerophosphotransferase
MGDDRDPRHDQKPSTPPGRARDEVVTAVLCTPRLHGHALFTSWQGLFYSDNPRALSEALHRRAPAVPQVWVVGEATGPVPERITPVLRGTPEHMAALEGARWIVSNDTIHDPFRKAPGTTYLQTWHGTPLKRIAFDVARPVFAGHETYGEELARDVARWDVLLSPNRFSTDILRGAFRFTGEVLETGYPRNDLLLAPERDAIRAAVREALGIPDGVRAVLYAPTWRDDRPFSLELDLAAAARALGEDHRFLVRAHWHAGAGEPVEGDAVIDVTHHQDLRELYLAADVLVTDYSSAMVDFALTGKPILSYVYDLEHYRDVLRGFYVDLEAVAPGPLLTTSDAVIGALADLDAMVAATAERAAAFRARFCDLDDGRASERVLDAVFGL